MPRRLPDISSEPSTSGRPPDSEVAESGWQTVAGLLPDGLWRGLLESLPLAICLKDEQGRYQRYNPAFRRLLSEFGAHAARRDDDVFPPVVARRARQQDREALAQQLPVASDQRVFLEQGSLLLRVTRVPLDEGHLLVTIARLDGESASHGASAASAVSERELGDELSARALVAGFPCPAWLKDRQGRYLAVNQGFIEHARRQEQELLGRDDAEVFAAATDGQALDIDWTHVEGDVGLRRLVSGHEVKLLEVTRTVLRGRSGEELGWLGMARDRSDLRDEKERVAQLEDRLERAQRLENLGMLASGLAHDFNNLLAGMLGSAELALSQLRRSRGSDEAVQRVLDLHSAVFQAAGLTTAVLAYSRSSAARVQAIDLNEIVSQTLRLVEAAAPKGIAFLPQLAPELPAVEGDVAQLRQVILNLLTNALDAIGSRRGTISIASSLLPPAPDADSRQDERPRVSLEVRDTGLGMDAATLERMFEPFFTTKQHGHGLGLSAVRGIIERHGGHVWVASHPGQGSTVKVVLPASSERAVSMAPPSSARPEWRGSGTLLVIDDQPMVRSVAKLLLEESGFDVVEAETGADALDLVGKLHPPPRAILLDMTLPDATGERVLEGLRSVLPKVPVVVWSGFDEREMRRRFSSFDAVSYLRKPFTIERLLERLRGLLERDSEPAGG